VQIIDDRTEGQRITHCCLVIGTDPFLSGWGRAAGGVSYAAWACTPADAKNVERRIRARGDMLRVRVVCGNNYRPKKAGHLHIYVAQAD